MTAVPASGFTSVPAYRVVAHFVKQVKKLEPESALDALELKVRQYVRSLLAPLHGSWAEIGERWAVAQLGDPDLETLGQALQAADKDSPRSVVEDALRVGSQLLPRPDLAARFLLLPGDGDSKLMCQVMNGAMGITLGSQATLLVFWPMAGWLNWLGYTTVHEYTHLVRNHLFPRSLSGGRLVYQKTQEQETLLDAMVAPTPLPQIITPRVASPPAKERPTAEAKSGKSSVGSRSWAPTSITSCPDARSQGTIWDLRSNPAWSAPTASFIDDDVLTAYIRGDATPVQSRINKYHYHANA